MDWNDCYIASAFLPIAIRLLLLQLWTAETYRPTRDLDLLGRGISNVSCRKIFSEVCSQKVGDDGLTFLPDTIRVERIRVDEAYEGVRVRLEARLGDVRVPLQIDVGLGDTIVPASEELQYPTLLKFPGPHCMPILRRALLRKSSKPWSNSVSRIAE
jgi:Nucleotidyl transferase AbiEii toxin, Type IV TA system